MLLTSVTTMKLVRCKFEVTANNNIRSGFEVSFEDFSKLNRGQIVQTRVVLVRRPILCD